MSKPNRRKAEKRKLWAGRHSEGRKAYAKKRKIERLQKRINKGERGIKLPN